MISKVSEQQVEILEVTREIEIAATIDIVWEQCLRIWDRSTRLRTRHRTA